MGYIYGIYYNGLPVYVGQTIKSIEDRWLEHKRTGLRTTGPNLGFAIHAVMRKYGVQNFSIQLIESIIDNNNLNDREKFWIKELHTHISEQGYNLTWGGEFRPDYITVPCYQYNLKGEFLQAYHSIEDAARAVDGNHSNIIKVLQGDLNSAYGFRWSYKQLDCLEPLSSNFTGSAKLINQYALDGTFIRQFNSTKEAARYLEVSQGNISSAANGKRKTAYGYIWRFA